MRADELAFFRPRIKMVIAVWPLARGGRKGFGHEWAGGKIGRAGGGGQRSKEGKG